MIEKLKKVAVFNVFPEIILKNLIPFIVVENFNAGDVIFPEGSDGNATYIIDSGEVEIRKQGKILSVFSSGDMFGEMALFGTEKRSAAALARTDVTLYKINNLDFRKFIFNHPEPGVHFLFSSIVEMAKRLRRTSDYFITVFETGKIVGGDYNLAVLSERIVNRLLGDIEEATGGMIVLLNPFTQMYDIAYEKEIKLLNLEKVVEYIKESKDKNIFEVLKEGVIFGAPIKEEKKLLGYMIFEKSPSTIPFAGEQEIIIQAVSNQVSLGILKAYNKQEDENRRRLEQSRLRGY